MGYPAAHVASSRYLQPCACGVGIRGRQGPVPNRSMSSLHRHQGFCCLQRLQRVQSGRGGIDFISDLIWLEINWISRYGRRLRKKVQNLSGTRNFKKSSPTPNLRIPCCSYRLGTLNIYILFRVIQSCLCDFLIEIFFSSQTQSLSSISHLLSEEDARRAYARMVVSSSRQRSIIGRGPQQDGGLVSQNRVDSGGVATKKSFFEDQL